MDEHMNRQAGRQTDRQTGVWADVQTVTVQQLQLTIVIYYYYSILYMN